MAYNLFSKQYAKSKQARFVVCDALPEAAMTFARRFEADFPGSLTVVLTPEEAALASETVITMLPSSPQVQEVYLDRILPALKTLQNSDPQSARNTLFIDSTTLDVTVARDVARQVKLISRMVDAPVSGGVAGAKAGTLSFLVGGDEADFKLCHPILSLMGQRIIHCGLSGAGLGAKICNNLILGVQQIAVAEAMLLGQKLGLDPAVLTSVVSSSTGSCWSISVNNPVPHSLPDKSPPCERDYDGGFATSLMLKDMGLASELALKTRVPLPLGKAVENLYREAISMEPKLARKDFSSVYKFLESK